MIEDVRLDVFVDSPFGRVREAVNLQRQSLGPRAELTNNQRHAFVDLRVILQVVVRVCAKSADVRQPPSIHFRVHLGRESLVVVGQLLFLVLNVVLQQCETREMINFVLRLEADRRHVDEKLRA